MEPLYDANKVTGKLAGYMHSMERAELAMFVEHFEYGTSATALARVLTDAGMPIGASTIKDQRRNAKIEE